MTSSMVLARARTALGELLWPSVLQRGRADAARVWSSISPRLHFSRDMASNKRRARFVRNIVDANLPTPVRYLEIGSFEGGSLVLIHALLKGQLHATVIDPFEDYDELAGTKMSSVEAAFHANVKAVGANVRVLKGASVLRLPELIAAGELFDLIYIDGAHTGLDVTADAVLSWRLLAPGGLMIFDDYRNAGCKPAIDAFVNLVKRDAIVGDVASQVFLRRCHPATA
jgi:predicted O-methyltransferase YrrM